MADAEQRGRAWLNKYKDPFISTMLKPQSLYDYEVGEKINVVDSINNETREVVITRIKKSYPHNGDELSVGSKEWKIAEWGKFTIERIKRLEEEIQQQSDFLVQINNFSHTVEVSRRYCKAVTKSLSTDGFVFGHPTQGVFGTDKFGDPFAAEATQRIVWKNQTVVENFRSTDFKDVATTADWDTTAQLLTLSAFDPVAHYILNSDSTDSSGNGNDGADTAVSYVAGKINNAASFNGTTSLITVTDAASIQNIFDGGGTIAAWIFPDSIGENGAGQIVNKRLSGNDGYALSLRTGGVGTLDINFFQDFSGTDGNWQSTSAVITEGEWNHVAVVYDADAVGNNPIIYVNGGVVALTEVTTPVGTRTTDVGNDLAIGNRTDQLFTFDGEIDDVRIYGSALTLAQISSIYNAGTGTESEFGNTATSSIIYDNAVNITSAIMTVTATSGIGNLALEMRVDGVNWESATNDTLLTFANVGQELEWRITASGDATITNINIVVVES